MGRRRDPAPELQRVLAGLDLFGLPFPVEFGGSDGTPTELVIVAEELGHAVLDVAMCYSGRLIPTLGIHEWGSDEQRARLAPDIVSGRRNYAVAISEPDAGSDAAALRTTADDRGDHFVVNGQKMWCTGAGLPDTTILMYVRTDPQAPKHRGLSALLVDPEAPGVTLRRIPTMARHILGTYEVFLDDVRVPKDDHRWPARRRVAGHAVEPRARAHPPERVTSAWRSPRSTSRSSTPRPARSSTVRSARSSRSRT